MYFCVNEITWSIFCRYNWFAVKKTYSLEWNKPPCLPKATMACSNMITSVRPTEICSWVMVNDKICGHDTCTSLPILRVKEVIKLQTHNKSSALVNPQLLLLLQNDSLFCKRGNIDRPWDTCNVTVLLNLFTGPHSETAKITVYPWPFVPSGKSVNVSITVTPGKRTLNLCIHAFILITTFLLLFHFEWSIHEYIFCRTSRGFIFWSIFPLLFYRLSHHSV